MAGCRGWHRAGAVLATLALIAAAGCGFRPLYGDRTPAAATADAAGSEQTAPTLNDLAAIDVVRIPNRQGQELRNALTDRLNPARQAEPSRYALSVDLRQYNRQQAIDRSGLATRASLTMTARYSLTEQASGRVLLAANARSVVGYNLLAGQPASYFSTVVAANDAQSRAIEQIAGQMLARLSAYFDKHPGGRSETGEPAASPTIAVEPGFSEESETTLDDAGLDPLPRDGEP